MMGKENFPSVMSSQKLLFTVYCGGLQLEGERRKVMMPCAIPNR